VEVVYHATPAHGKAHPGGVVVLGDGGRNGRWGGRWCASGGSGGSAGRGGGGGAGGGGVAGAGGRRFLVELRLTGGDAKTYAAGRRSPTVVGMEAMKLPGVSTHHEGSLSYAGFVTYPSQLLGTIQPPNSLLSLLLQFFLSGLSFNLALSLTDAK